MSEVINFQLIFRKSSIYLNIKVTGFSWSSQIIQKSPLFADCCSEKTASQKMSAWEFVSIAGVLASLSGVIIAILGVVEISSYNNDRFSSDDELKTDSF
jgi:hypothetical protein